MLKHVLIVFCPRSSDQQAMKGSYARAAKRRGFYKRCVEQTVRAQSASRKLLVSVKLDRNTLVCRVSVSKHHEGTARSMFVSRDWHVLSRTAPYYYVRYAVHRFHWTLADREFQDLVPIPQSVHVNSRRHTL